MEIMCENCEEVKDEWYDFTKTDKDGKHYKVSICKFCRLGGTKSRKSGGSIKSD